ncbi:MAG: alpha-amylase [Burkholderiales bacterium PBB3]|nr:MAG: alpha-amylase [Burkholderiales bacterium PBB3]
MQAFLLHSASTGAVFRSFLRSAVGASLALGALAATAQPTPQPTPTIDISPVEARAVPSALPAGWQYGAFMEIFVRAYKDSNGDGVGDLKGVTQSLDYLKDLGIKGIWLMPITTNADGDHGYATTDFRNIDPAYGTLADFDELIAQAHQRGIGVIMDYVINHSAAGHPMFVSAKTGPASPFYDWFVWEKTAPTGWDIWGKNPWTQTEQGAYFGTFGPHMPDFNFKNPAVLAYHQSSLRFWLNRGLDGYRLDAVPHLVETNAKDWNDQPESRKITSDLRALITGYPQRYVVCEATANPQIYAAPDLCGGAFAFGLEKHLAQAAQGDKKSIQAVADYFKTAPQSMATFASNHDIFAGRRLWDQVHGNAAQYKLAAAAYLLLPGTPFIYYGEEIGMAGLKETKDVDGDLPIRAPMSWTADTQGAGFTTGTPFRAIAPNVKQQNAAAEVASPASIHAFYKRMLKLRNAYPSLASGSYVAPFVQRQVLGYQRSLGAETSLVLINYAKQSARVRVPSLPAHALLNNTDGRRIAPVRANTQGQARITLPAQSVQVFTVSLPSKP